MSIDNSSIVNNTCDNISHIYNSVNTAISEYNDDVQLFKNKDLTDSSNTFPSTVINNVPNATQPGQYALWSSTSNTYQVEGFSNVKLGLASGLTFQGNNAVAIGIQSGRHNQGTNAVSIGWNSGRTHQGTEAVAIGTSAGNLTQGQNTVAIGSFSGRENQQDWGVSIGLSSGQISQGNNSVAIGAFSGQYLQSSNSVALGLYAGWTSQGKYSIAIGALAGLTQQAENSICINASGVGLTPNVSNSCFIDPVRNIITSSNLLSYNTSSKEVGYCTNVNLSNPLIVPASSATDCSVQFSGSKGCGIFSSGADTLDISTGGVSRFNVNNTRTYVSSGQLILLTGSASTPSYSFNGNSTTGWFSGGPSSNTIKLSTNGVERLSVDTLAHTFSLPIKLQTSGGTASNLDFYQELTHTSGWNFGSTNSNVQSGNFRFVRIGKLVTMTITYDWSSSLTMGDVSGGTAVMNTAVISVFRPSQTLSFIGFAQVAGSNTTVRILQNSSGTTEITPLAGGNFANGTTLRLWTNSFSYSLT